jgi:glycosyltransferase involved in cell wall biosynthesis
MKIVHLSLASTFNEEMNYQENQFIRQHVKDKVEVTLITTNYRYEESKIVRVPTEYKVVNQYLKIIRLKYRYSFLGFLSRKIRSVKGLYKILIDENPDIVYHHSLQTFELLTVKKYKKKFGTVLIVDSHEDYHNSARNFLSKNILHRLYYNLLIRLVYSQIDTIFYVSTESKKFLVQVYKISDEKMKFLPLGGDPISSNLYDKIRFQIRNELQVDSKEILLLHSGKLGPEKKTEMILDAFNSMDNDGMTLLIIGSMETDYLDLLISKINNNPKIKFLGWKNAEELTNYLIASDVYIQPGTQSATFQVAACLNNALVAYPYESYKSIFNSYEIAFVSNTNDLMDFFKNVSEKPEYIEDMRRNAYLKSLKTINNELLVQKIYNHLK